MRKIILSAYFILTVPVLAGAQEKEKGQLTGSFETNSVAYFKDGKTGANFPDDRFGSNNYLKMDYTHGRLAVGVQLESYLPVLQGYPKLSGTDLMFRYATWADKDFTVTAGDFYEQFGNGLLFRSWEDRSLGFNNSIEGARVAYNWQNKLYVKGLWGRPRLYMERAGTQVRGIDAGISISNLLDWETNSLNIEASYLNRYNPLEEEYTYLISSPNTDSYSVRFNYENTGFSLRGEYVGLGKDIRKVNNDLVGKKGGALFAEAGYSGGGFGVLATFRRLEHMGNRIVRDDPDIGNTLNYIPALTQQYTYMLTNLHPYSPQDKGETGGQIDLFYNIKRGSAVGGRYGMKVHLNFSTFYTLGKYIDGEVAPNLTRKNELLYRETNLDVEKWWNRKFKTAVIYCYQEYNPSYGIWDDTYTSHVFVGDVTYKFSSKTSLRAEGQYLLSPDDDNDWIAGLLEINLAPRWSIYASDMLNTSDKSVHYYNGGFSYAYSRTRVQLSYGRNRAGYVCSGGVCRMMPAYTGFNLAMNISF